MATQVQAATVVPRTRPGSRRLAVVCVALAVVCTSISACRRSPNTGSALVDEALEVLERDFIRSDTVDWKHVTTEAAATLNRNGSDAAAMRRVVDLLAEPHTNWIPSHDVTVNDFYVYDAAVVKQAIAEAELKVHDGIATLVIPPVQFAASQAATEFANAVQERIELAAGDATGWIIDLRRNWGGNMWPMLAGLSCFFAPGPLGYLQGADGTKAHWSVEDGAAILGTPTEPVSKMAVFSLSDQSTPTRGLIMTKTSRPCAKRLWDAKVAVLVSHATSSSGEALAISFFWREPTPSFSVLAPVDWRPVTHP